MNTQEKLQYILNELKTVPTKGFYKINECIKEKKDFYIERASTLEKITIEQLKNHSFVSETFILSERKEKQSFKARLLKSVKGLERHAYAPEMNKLHFNKGRTFSAPQKTSIEEAIELFINKTSLVGIKAHLLIN